MDTRKKPISKKENTKTTRSPSKGAKKLPDIPIDGSKRKKAEEDIHDLARFPSENHNPVLRIDQDGTLRYANKAALVLLVDWKLEPSKPAPKALKSAAREVLVTGTEKTVELSCGEHIFAFDIGPTPAGKDVHIYGLDITERKQAEEALHENEEKYRSIVETTSEWIWEMDINGIHTFSNKAVTALLGYRPEEFIGQSAVSFLHAEDRSEVEAKLPLLIAEKSGWRGWVLRWRHKDGSYRFLESNAEPILDSTGYFRGYRGSDRDITERKQVEEALRGSEEKFRTIAEQITEMIYFTDERGIIKYVSPSVVSIFGYTPIEMMGHNFTDFLAENDIPKAMAAFSRASTKKEPSRNLELRMKRKDGSLFSGELNGTLYLSGDINSGAVGIIRDITNRKQAEVALKESELRYRGLFENSPVSLWEEDFSAVKKHIEKLKQQGVVDFREFFESHPDVLIECVNEVKVIDVNMATLALMRADNKAQLIGNLHKFVRDNIGKDFIDEFVSIAEGKTEFEWEGKNYTLDNQILAVSLHWSAAPGYEDTLEKVLLSLIDITERKRAEAALRDGERKISEALEFNKKILNNSSIGILTFKESGQCVSANEAAARVTGGTVVQLLAQNFHEILSWKKSGMYQAAVKALETGVEQLLDVHIVTTFGKDSWLSFSFSRFDSAGERHLLVFASDITDRKQAEKKLEEERILLRTMIDNLPDRVYAMDIQGRKILSNIADWQASGGKAMEDVIGKTDLDTYPPELAKDYWALDKAVIDSGESVLNLEESGLDPQGNRVSVLSSKVPLRDSQGKIIGLVGIGRDITERKQTQTLQEAVYRIAAAAEATSSLDELYPQIHQIISSVMPAEYFYITLYDEAQDLLRFPYFKDAADEPFVDGIQPGKGLSAYVLRTGKSLLCTQAVLDELERKGKVKQLGVPSAIWLGVPLVVEGKTIGAMVVQHFSDPKAYGEREQHMLEFVSTQVAIAINRKRTEDEIRHLNAELEQRVEERTRELREAEEQLVRKEKLATLGQLAGGVGHELRNPLGVINTSVYYLKLVQPDADEKVKQHLAIIEQEIHNSERIINDLLDFGRVISAEQEQVPADKLVRRTLERFPVPPAVKLKLELPDDIPNVYADPRQMEQVLGNLVTNAYQAMNQEGKLTISARRQKGMVGIAVTDTGKGISPENMKKLFEPLFTTKVKGIGLGLAVSKKLAEANSGRIEAESEAGKGSTFTLYLPIKRKERAKTRE